MDKEKLIDIFKKSRPNAKESTIKLYTANIMKLMKLFDTDNLNFLKNHNEVENKLEKLHYTTKRNYLNAIVVYLMGDKEDKELIEQYVDMRDKLNKQYEDEQATGVISDKQKDNFVDISEVNKMIEEMKNEIKDKNLFIKKNEDLKPKEKQLIQVYTLFSIYTRLPLRNDLAGMSVINKRDYNKLSDEDKKEHNYMVINKNNMYMVLNQYKTSSKYKELNIDIPKDLEKILRQYIKINGMGVLFKSGTGTPLSRNALTQLLIKTTKKYMGKSISSTMLRKIYLSSKYSAVKEEMENDSKIMAHSVDVAQSTYIKKPQSE